MKPIIMPVMGQDMETGLIVQWIKKENDPVKKGEAILVTESEKASFEVEAEQDGILLKILYPEGSEVEVLKPVGYIGQPGEKYEQPQDKEIDGENAAPVPIPEQGEAAASPAMPDKVMASPSAKRIARERGLELVQEMGSGPGGRITKRDLPQPAADSPPMPVEDVVVPFGKMRKRIAERLTASKRNIPHIYLFENVDMTDTASWRKRLNADHTIKITITDLIIKATAMSLRAFPRLNAHVTEAQITFRKDVNVGVAVAVNDGLLVPVIPNADQLSLTQIAEKSKNNAEAAHRGKMSMGKPGTFTITSLGMFGVRQFVPIINPPECAILAVGAVTAAVVPVPGGIGVRNIMPLTLACDHRAVDGAEAAGLLKEIKKYLEDVATLQHWV